MLQYEHQDQNNLNAAWKLEKIIEGGKVVLIPDVHCT